MNTYSTLRIMWFLILAIGIFLTTSLIGMIILAIGMLGSTLIGRPRNPPNLSWDIGLSNDQSTHGTTTKFKEKTTRTQTHQCVAESL